MDDHPLDIDWAEMGAFANFSFDDLRDNDLGSFSLMCDMIMEDRPLSQSSDFDSLSEHVFAEGLGQGSADDKSSKLPVGLSPVDNLEKEFASVGYSVAEVPGAKGGESDIACVKEAAGLVSQSMPLVFPRDGSAGLQPSTSLHTISFPSHEEGFTSNPEIVSIDQHLEKNAEKEVLLPAKCTEMEVSLLQTASVGSEISLTSGGETAQTANLNGIQATDMNSLLEQFEDASSWQGSEDMEIHQLMKDGKFKSHSVPSSRVCSTTASPANTPPATPPPLLLNKIRNRQKESLKRKVAMLPMGGPAKRGRGHASGLQMCSSTGGSSRLQKVLSRHKIDKSVNPDQTLQPFAQSQVDAQESDRANFQSARPQVISVLQALPVISDSMMRPSLGSSGCSASVLNTLPVLSSGSVSSAQKGADLKTSPLQPQVLSLLQTVPKFSDSGVSTCHRFQPKQSQVVLLSQPAVSGGSVSAINVAGVKTVCEPFSMPQTQSPVSQVKQVSLLATTSVKPSIVTTAMVKNRLVVPNKVCNSEILTATKDSKTPTKTLTSVHPKPTSSGVSSGLATCTGPSEQHVEAEETRTVILIRGEDRLPAIHQASILDHDYAVGCPQRIDTDIRELDTSPTKKRSHKQTKTVQSIPVCGANGNSKLQAASLHCGLASGRNVSSSCSGGEKNSMTENSTVMTGSVSGSAGSKKINENKPCITACKVQGSENGSNQKGISTVPVFQTPMLLKEQWQQLKEIVQNITQITNNRLMNGVPAMNSATVSAQNNRPSTSSQIATSTSITSEGQSQVVSRPAQQAPTPVLTAVKVKNPQSVQVGSADIPVCQTGAAQQQIGNVSSVIPRTAEHDSSTGEISIPAVVSQSKTQVSSSSSTEKESLTFSGTSNFVDDPIVLNSKKTHLVSIHCHSPTQEKKKETSCTIGNTTWVGCKKTSESPVKPSQSFVQSVEERRTVAIPEASTMSNSGCTKAGCRDALSPCIVRTESDSLDNPVLYSMPSFNNDFPSSVLNPVVSVEEHSDNRVPVLEEASPVLLSSCDKSDKTTVDPVVAETEVIPPLDSPASANASPHSTCGSAGGDNAFGSKFDHGEEFATLWEECKAARLAQMAESIAPTNRTAEKPLSSSKHVTESTSSGHSFTNFVDMERCNSDLSSHLSSSHSKEGSDNWNVNTSVNSDFFSKIPSYLSEISIQQNTGRKQLKVDDIEKGLSASDHLPPDHSAVPPKQEEAVLDKIPSYFKCFTDSQQYDGTETIGSFSKSEHQQEQVVKKNIRSSSDAPCSFESTSTKLHSSRTKGRKGPRGRKDSREGRGSNNRSVNGRSRSDARQDHDRQRRSPTLSGSSHSSCKSRSHSISPSRLSCSSRSRSRSRSRSSDRRYASTSRDKRFGDRRETAKKSRGCSTDGMRRTEERKIVYVGKIPDRYTKRQLYDRFKRFGVIESASVHFREAGDNYGFVTFRRTEDAYRAIENGNNVASDLHFDLCFGGRRQFCGNDYADLDGNRVIEEEYNPGPTQKESFDQLLRKYYKSQR